MCLGLKTRGILLQASLPKQRDHLTAWLGSPVGQRSGLVAVGLVNHRSYHVFHCAQILGTLGVAVVFSQVRSCEAVLVPNAQVHAVYHKYLTALRSRKRTGSVRGGTKLQSVWITDDKVINVITSQVIGFAQTVGAV